MSLGSLGFLKKIIEFAATLPRNLPDARRCLSLPKNSAAASPTHVGERRPTTSGRHGQNGTSHDIHRINNHQINQDMQTLVMTDFNIIFHPLSMDLLRLQVRIFREICGWQPGTNSREIFCEFQKTLGRCHRSTHKGVLKSSAPFRKGGLWLETTAIWKQFWNLKDSGKSIYVNLIIVAILFCNVYH